MFGANNIIMPGKKRRKLPLTKPKTPKELQDTRKAIAICRNVLENLEPFGRSERDVAREIKRRIRSQGAGLSFKTIVSAGRNTAFVHHKPGSRIIRKELPLMIDFGAKYRGQCSDITRMHVPKSAPKKLKKIYQDASNIQRSVIRKIKPGIEARKLNELYKNLLEKKRYKVKHSIGHGLGPRIHERAGELRPGIVLTVEPGIYLDKFGCRIEDMILIKKQGIEILSSSIPRNPFRD